MVTLQDYLNQKYPTKEGKELIELITVVSEEHNLRIRFTKTWVSENGEQQEEFRKIGTIMAIPKDLDLDWEGLSLTDYPNIEEIIIKDYKLTSVDFLNTIPNLEKLKQLIIHGNNIKPTDISIFSRLVNLEVLMIGTNGWQLKEGKHNQFYGSLKSYYPLTKLESICIEATDVNEGLEYLPFTLVNKIKNKEVYYKNYDFIQCSPYDTNAKCVAIQNQLRPFDYDVEAWQLAHPAEMFRARPELFASGDSKKTWLNAITNKLEKTQEKLKEIQKDSPDKIKKIKRLNTKLGELNAIKQLLEERSIFEDSLVQGVRWYDKFKEEKATQTEIKTQNQRNSDRRIIGI